MAIQAETNANDFLARMMRIAEKVGTNVDKVVQAYAGHLLVSLVQATPIKSGQARANWQVAIDGPNSVFIQYAEKNRNRNVADHADVQDAIDHGQSVILGYTRGHTIDLFNNAPYIVRLNQGYSPQAQAGYVEDILNASGFRSIPNIQLTTTGLGQ